MSKELIQALDIMTNQYNAQKKQIDKKKALIEDIKLKIKLCIDQDDFMEADRLIHILSESEGELTDLQRNMDRCCSICGGLLVKGSINWAEGFHIDGCE